MNNIITPTQCAYAKHSQINRLPYKTYYNAIVYIYEKKKLEKTQIKTKKKII